MEKTSLHTDYTNLMSKLWIDLLFFIPEDGFLAEFSRDIEELKDINVWNTLYYLDENLGPVTFNQQNQANQVTLKGCDLESILFTLMDKKATLKSFEFELIFSKYFEQLDCLLFLTNWLQRNATNYIDLKGNEFELLKMQFHNYKTHFKAIVTHFYDDKSLFPKSKFGFSTDKEYLASIQISNQIKKLPLLNLKTNTNKVIEKPKTKKKEPLMTDKEIEDALISTYFSKY